MKDIEVSKEEKNQKHQYGRERHKNLSEHEKQRLVYEKIVQKYGRIEPLHK